MMIPNARDYSKTTGCLGLIAYPAATTFSCLSLFNVSADHVLVPLVLAVGFGGASYSELSGLAKSLGKESISGLVRDLSRSISKSCRSAFSRESNETSFHSLTQIKGRQLSKSQYVLLTALFFGSGMGIMKSAGEIKPKEISAADMEHCGAHIETIYNNSTYGPGYMVNEQRSKPDSGSESIPSTSACLKNRSNEKSFKKAAKISLGVIVLLLTLGVPMFDQGNQSRNNNKKSEKPSPSIS